MIRNELERISFGLYPVQIMTGNWLCYFSSVSTDKWRDWMIKDKFLSGTRGFLIFTNVSRSALEPTRTPDQWVSGALIPRIGWPGCETDRPLRNTASNKLHSIFHTWNLPQINIWLKKLTVLSMSNRHYTRSSSRQKTRGSWDSDKIS
jgi:hypothetical protein